jgi:hypothetical protein
VLIVVSGRLLGLLLMVVDLMLVAGSGRLLLLLLLVVSPHRRCEKRGA